MRVDNLDTLIDKLLWDTHTCRPSADSLNVYLTFSGTLPVGSGTLAVCVGVFGQMAQNSTGNERSYRMLKVKFNMASNEVCEHGFVCIAT